MLHSSGWLSLLKSQHIGRMNTTIAQVNIDTLIEDVNRLDPNFNWSSEFILEYLRGKDLIYRENKHVLTSIAQDCDYNDLVPGSMLVQKNRSGISSPITDALDIGHQRRIRVYSRSHKYIRAIDTHSLRPSSDIAYIDVPSSCKNKDVFNSFYLSMDRLSHLQPGIDRTCQLHQHRQEMVMNSQRFRGYELINVPIKQDYPYLVYIMTPQRLRMMTPDIFPEDPDNVQILQELKTINTNYSVADLMEWLKMRMSVRSSIQQSDRLKQICSGIEADVMTGLVLNNDGSMTCRSKNIDSAQEFLKSIGYESRLKRERPFSYYHEVLSSDKPEKVPCLDVVGTNSQLKELFNEYLMCRSCYLQHPIL